MERPSSLSVWVRLALGGERPSRRMTLCSHPPPSRCSGGPSLALGSSTIPSSDNCARPCLLHHVPHGLFLANDFLPLALANRYLDSPPPQPALRSGTLSASLCLMTCRVERTSSRKPSPSGESDAALGIWPACEEGEFRKTVAARAREGRRPAGPSLRPDPPLPYSLPFVRCSLSQENVAVDSPPAPADPGRLLARPPDLRQGVRRPLCPPRSPGRRAAHLCTRADWILPLVALAVASSPFDPAGCSSGHASMPRRRTYVVPRLALLWPPLGPGGTKGREEDAG